MNLYELKIKIAEVLGVSDSEKDLAFDVFTYQTFYVLDEEETLKVPGIGFFQYKKRPFQIGNKLFSNENMVSSNTLVFAPLKENFSGRSHSLFLTIDIEHQKKDLFELDESVFSIGVGKPILPISKDPRSQNNTETSYALLKKSIEERVSEVIAESEHLQNFDIWEDYLSNIDSESVKSISKSSATLHKLTDDIEYAEDEIAPSEDELEDYDFPDVEDVHDKDDDLTKLESELEDFSALGSYDKDTNEPSVVDENLMEEDKQETELPLHEKAINEDSFEEQVETELGKEEHIDIDQIVDRELEDYEEPNIEEEVIEEKEVKNEFEPPTILLKDKSNDENKFWGIEDFKSTSEKHSSHQEDTEDEEENIDWDWGDELLNEDSDASINVDEEFNRPGDDIIELEEVDKDEIKDSDKRKTNLFIKLENSLSGVAAKTDDNADFSTDEYSDEDVIAPPTKTFRNTYEKNVIYEDENAKQKYYDDEDGFKAKFLKNGFYIFGAIAVIIILIMIFISPSKDKPSQQKTAPVTDQQSSEVVTREQVADEPNSSTGRLQNLSVNPDENPIEERTRQMQQGSNISQTAEEQNQQDARIQEQVQTSANKQIVNTDLYRNIPNESTVRGLIFTDGSKYYVQVSSWPTSEKAETETRRLRSLGYDAFIIKAFIQKYKSTWYRVKIGAFNSVYEADRFIKNNKF